jgi:hypothetical protein
MKVKLKIDHSLEPWVEEIYVVYSVYLTLILVYGAPVRDSLTPPFSTSPSRPT